MTVTDGAGANTGFSNCDTRFVRSAVIELVGRPYLDLFYQRRIIPPGITLRIKLIPYSHQFVCICPAVQKNTSQKNFKVVIQNVSIIIRTRKLADAAELSIRKLLLEKNMKLFYLKVQVKHLTIPANVTTQDFEDIFYGPLPDLVVVGLMADKDFAGHYNKYPLNF